jgi:uncharacterized membrane protein YhfC
MSEINNIVLGENSIPSLVLTVIMLIVLPTAWLIYWVVKHKGKLKVPYFIAGMIGFLVSARILEAGVHYVCLIMDNPISRFISGNTVVYVLYGALMAGIFEECGRHIILKYILKKDRTRENAVLYGTGHGVCEVWLLILPSMISYLSIAVLLSMGDAETVFASLNIPAEMADTMLPVFQGAAGFNYWMMATNVMERFFAVIVHIGLTVVVSYGIYKAKKWCLPLAILLHAMTDVTAAMYQRGAAPLWLAEVWIAVCAVVILIIAVKLYRDMKSDDDHSNGKNGEGAIAP